MTVGRLIAVVGPSGVGKDSIMMGLKKASPELHLVRRVITRAPGLGGEDYEAVTETEFLSCIDEGRFTLHWSAHGLHYGIPTSAKCHLNKGIDCLVNFSRSALLEAANIFPKLTVLNITATPETLAKRLVSRGRENEGEIAKRIAVANRVLPSGLDVITLSNDGPLEETIAHAQACLQPVRSK